MKNKFYIHTLGCRLNQAESDQMMERLIAAGFCFTEKVDQADAIIINTCSVTHKADRQSRQLAHRLKRLSPDAQLIITGCSVVDSDQVDLCLKNKKDIAEALTDLLGEPKSEPDQKSEPESKLEPENESDGSTTQQPKSHNQRTRALVKIQTGCDNYCAYCIVPYLRGKPASVATSEIIAQINNKEQQGFQEVVLTGVNIGKYGEVKGGLSQLIKKILADTKIPRIRLSSINPEDIDNQLIDLFVEERLCPHLHLSLQSGSDSVLRRMGRRYNTQSYWQIVDDLYEKYPNFAFTTDVIVGFPGETEAEFTESCSFVEKVGFLKTHIFRYSVREGTRAAEMKDQIDEGIKKLRAKKLNEVARAAQEKFQQKMIDRELPVLFEKKVSHNLYQGTASNFMTIQQKSSQDLTNKIKYVKVKEENLIK